MLLNISSRLFTYLYLKFDAVHMTLLHCITFKTINKHCSFICNMNNLKCWTRGRRKRNRFEYLVPCRSSNLPYFHVRYDTPARTRHQSRPACAGPGRDFQEARCGRGLACTANIDYLLVLLIGGMVPWEPPESPVHTPLDLRSPFRSPFR